jgi:hypothetical protein
MQTTYQIRKTMYITKPNIKSNNEKSSVIMNNSLGTVYETTNFDEVSTMCQALNSRYDYIGHKYEINTIQTKR